MPTLGIDLTDRGARAVIVDDDGRVLRAASELGEDVRAAARKAVDEAASGRKADRTGVAVDLIAPDQPDADGVLTAIQAPTPHHVASAGAAAVGAEALIGGAKGARHAVCLWAGERVLAGVLFNGEPWAGAHGLAGSAAWFALNPVERQDYRKLGSLAAEVSSKGIARRLAWRIQAGDESAVLERAGDLDAITATHVFDGARAADGVAISVVRDTAKYIGMAIANLASAIDPEIIVLAGPITAAGDLLLEAVRQECGRRLPPQLIQQFTLAMSPLGEYGVAIGAARLAMLAGT